MLLNLKELMLLFRGAKELLLIVGAKEMFEDYEVRLPKMDSEGYNIQKVYKNIIKDMKNNYSGLYKIKELKGLYNES